MPQASRKPTVDRMKLTSTHHKTTATSSEQHDPGAAIQVPVNRVESRGKGRLLWASQILLAVIFLLVAAAPKLTGSHDSVHEFALIGAGQWMRYFVGLAELAGVIGLFTPWLAGLAAAGLALDMVGATIINATVLRNTTYGHPEVTAVLCAVFALIAYGRREQIKNLASVIRRQDRKIQ